MPIKPREDLPYGFGRLKQTIKRFAEPAVRSIRFGRWLGHWSGRRKNEVSAEWMQKLQQHPPVFVYQMGKVASTSIYRSLDQQYHGAVIHGHYFSSNHSDTKVRSLHEHVTSVAPPLRIISMVREPISRNISAFFQNFKRDTGMEVEDCGKSMVELRDMFLKNYPHEIPWVWFDNNIKKHFGIDVYEYPFPEDGHIHIRNGQVELLLMRHDLKDSLKEKLVSEFVGIDGFKIVRSNVSAEKEYFELLQAFKELKLPVWYLYRIFSSKYPKHFYQGEIGELFAQWREPEEEQAA